MPAALAITLLSGPAAARSIGQIEFTPCELKSPRSPVFIEAECATLAVPENPAEPGGRKIVLNLTLVPAKVRNARPDPVVLLAGGPGQGASEAFLPAAAAFAPLRKDRHVLLVDQRGTGKSNPLSCPFPDWKAAELITVPAMRGMASDCRRDLEKRADLRFYTTGDYIRDLESVRAAMGVAQFNLAGASYGTRVALEYLRRHPDAIRSVFLDSVAPPELALAQDHARNLEDALEKMSARCRADPACQKRFADPMRTLRELARRRPSSIPVRYRHPNTHEWTEAPFTQETLGVVARLFAYAPESLSLLPLLADEAARGRPEAMLAQAEMVLQWVGESLAHGMELSVLCAEDEPWLRENPADANTLMGGEFIEYVRAQCSAWPRGNVPKDFKTPVGSDKPVLLLAGEFDPVTPPRYADQVARTLSNSRTLIAKGQGHTPMAKGCMPRLLREFVETLKPKELDTSCLDALGESPFFLDFAGPAP
jgi:pimeloyl-ACP methyl ester carboxylesterase